MLKKLVAVVHKVKLMKKRKVGSKKVEEPANSAPTTTPTVKRSFTLSLDEAISDATRSRDGDPLYTTGDTVDSNPDQLAASPSRHSDSARLPFWADSVCGGRYSNEDAYCVVPNFIVFPLHSMVCPPSCPFLQHQQQQQQAGHPPPHQQEEEDQQQQRDQQQQQQSHRPQRSAGGEGAGGGRGGGAGPREEEGGAKEVLHFFGVYDGHGGCAAAEYSAQRLHRHLREDALPQILQARGGSTEEATTASKAAPEPTTNGSRGSSLEPAGQLHTSASGTATTTTAATTATPEGDPGAGPATSGEAQDAAAPSGAEGRAAAAAAGDTAGPVAANPAATAAAAAAAPPGEGDAAAAAAVAAAAAAAAAASDKGGGGRPRGERPCTVETAFTSAFLQTHKEFVACAKSTYVGTTAVVALVGESNIWVANCGDSRAVLCRGGQAIPLSSDHKPTRDDEAARVKAAGGHVLWDRVMGELAVSRAIGDEFLRPYVIADPEVVHMPRSEDDELLLLATDGLWDVFTNQEACDVALKQLGKGWAEGVPHCRQAARHLIREALMRSTRDNVTVVVVDLRMLKAAVVGGLPGIGGCAEHSSVLH